MRQRGVVVAAPTSARCTSGYSRMAACVDGPGRVSRVPLKAGTTSFTGIQVSSGGTAPVGDDMFIDQFRAS